MDDTESDSDEDKYKNVSPGPGDYNSEKYCSLSRPEKKYEH